MPIKSPRACRAGPRTILREIIDGFFSVFARAPPICSKLFDTQPTQLPLLHEALGSRLVGAPPPCICLIWSGSSLESCLAYDPVPDPLRVPLPHLLPVCSATCSPSPPPPLPRPPQPVLQTRLMFPQHSCLWPWPCHTDLSAWSFSLCLSVPWPCCPETQLGGHSPTYGLWPTWRQSVAGQGENRCGLLGPPNMGWRPHSSRLGVWELGEVLPLYLCAFVSPSSIRMKGCRGNPAPWS